VTTRADIIDSAVVSMTGNGAITMSADSDATSDATAEPNTDTVAGNFGLGASLALNIVNDRAIAELASAAVTGAGDIMVLSAGGHTMTTTARAGAGSDGLTVVPAVAISLSNVARTAEITAGPALTATGNVTVGSTAAGDRMKITTTSEGSATAASARAAAGISLALTIANHDVTATTNRDVTTDGDVMISAIGSSMSSTDAKASAAGAPGEGEDGAPDDTEEDGVEGGVNKQVDEQRTLVDEQAKENRPDDVDEADAGAGDKKPPSAKTSKGPITVAAAIGVTVATTTAKAWVPTGVTVTADGKITVQAANNTDAATVANGSSNTEGASGAVGVAVAINFARVDTTATVEGTVVAGNGLTIKAARTIEDNGTPADATDDDDKHELSALAISGASGGKTTVAFSLGLNIANVTTIGELAATGTATVTGGDVEILAESVGQSTATARPNDPADGGSLGIGASVALNIVNDRATAQIADGGTLDLTTTGATKLIASGGHSSTTTADAGASGSVALVPALAIAISNVTRTGLIAGAAADLVTLNGDLLIESRGPPGENATTTTATGAAETDGSAAIGIAFGLTTANHTYSATTERNVTTTGDVTINAFGRSTTNTKAVAAAGGQSKDDTATDGDGDGTTGDGDADLGGLINQEQNAADEQAAENKPEGTTDAEAGSNGVESPKPETSSGPLTVAGALAVNLATTKNLASIPAAVTITADGTVTVASKANTDARATADGSTTDGGDLGVGVAVAINLANIDNLASVHGTVVANSLTIDASMLESSLDDVWIWNEEAKSWQRVANGAELPTPVNHQFSQEDREWQTLDQVDKLADAAGELHYFDGDAQDWVKVASAETLPTGPADGDYINLTAADGATAAGVYVWDAAAMAGEGDWVAPDAALAAGAATDSFPEAPAAGKLHLLTPKTDTVVELTETDGANAPGVYKFNAGWAVQTPTRLSSFPEEPADGDLVTLTPANGDLFEKLGDDIYEWDETAAGGDGDWVAKTAFPVASGTDLPTTGQTNGDFFRVAEHKLGASATSGAAGGVAVAVSFALNVANVDTLAEITDTADVTIDGGELTLGSASNAGSFVDQLPARKTAGGKLGVGASLALNIINDDGRATIADGASIDTSAATAVTFAVRGGHASSTFAKAGASADGVALVPSIAITISNIDRVAEVLPGNDLDIAGNLTIGVSAGPAETAARTTAEGAAESAGKTAVGLALAITIANHNVEAKLQRNVVATGTGNVTLEAFGQSASETNALASAAGAPNEDSPDAPANGADGVNTQIADEIEQADTTANENQKPGETEDTGANDAEAPAAKTSQGTITVAAAIAVNLATTSSKAIIGDSISIDATGLVAVRTSANTDAAARADGSSANGGKFSIGLAVALNLANVTNEAVIEGTVVAGGGIEASASMTDYFTNRTHENSATAISGASGNGSGTGISVAVSLALSIANVTTTGRIASTGANSVTVDGGAINLKAESLGSTEVSATPSEPVEGGSIGVGASVALAVINDDALAEVTETADLTVSSTDDVPSAIEALGGHSATATAVAGAGADGVAFVPSIAVVISNVDRFARILGATTDPVIELAGSLTIAGRAPPSLNVATTKATGSASASGKAAVGFALGLTIANHTVTATTERNLDIGGAVTLEAIGQSNTRAAAIAASAGEDPANANPETGDPGDKGGVSGLVQDERAAADEAATDGGGDDSGDAVIPDAETNSAKTPANPTGTITVAAAIAVNLANTLASATLPEGVTITSGGVVTVGTKANTDATAFASGGAANGGKLSVGGAVAINVANVDNLASVDGIVTSEGLVIDAGMVENELDPVFVGADNKWNRVDSGDELPAELVHRRYNVDTQNWEIIDSVDELPTGQTFRFDGDPAVEQWIKAPVGDQLPGAPADGDVFVLTAEDSYGNPDDQITAAAGTYKFDASMTSAQAPDGTWVAVVPATGDTFPDAPADGDVFVKTPAVDDVAVKADDNLVYRWDGAAWTAEDPVPDSGQELPGVLTNPSDGDLFSVVPAEDALFDLRATDGDNEAGIYKFVAGAWVEQTVTIDSGDELATTAADDAFFRPAEHTLGAIAESGASGDDVSIAVSFALHVGNITTDARLTDTAQVDLEAGELTLGAASNGYSDVRARPREKTVGGSAGVGISVAINIVDDDTKSVIEGGASIDATDATAVNLTAEGGHAMFTEAAAGAGSDGLSVVPGIGIGISNVERTAEILNDGDPTLVIGGDLKVTVEAPPTETANHVVANGSASSSGKAAVGLALGLAITNHTVMTVLERDVEAGGDVIFEAFGQSASSSTAIASAAGGEGTPAADAETPDADGNTGINKVVADEIESADETAAETGADGSGDAQAPQAETSKGTISVAASVAITLANTTSMATIPDGVSVTADGLVAVRTSANTDSGANANGPGGGDQRCEHSEQGHHRGNGRSRRWRRGFGHCDRPLHEQQSRCGRHRHLWRQWFRSRDRQ